MSAPALASDLHDLHLLDHLNVIKSAHGLHRVLSINQPIGLVFCDLPEYVNRTHQVFSKVTQNHF